MVPALDSGDRFLAQLSGELGRVHGHVARAVDLHHPLVTDAAPFHLRQREEIVGVLHQRLAELVEAAGAVLAAHGAPRPVVEGAPRGRDRLADLADARVGRRGDDGLGDRGDVVVATASGFDPSSVDVELIGVNKGGS